MSRLDAWLTAAIADAERRGLPELRPLLEGLARSTAIVRTADREQSESGPEPPATPTPAERP
jgi:hypothetical protein